MNEHINQELTNVYKDMKNIFGNLLSEVVRDSMRIGTLERSMNVVHLESTIKYLKYNNIDYKDLPTEEKIFCVINDFLIVCQNNYSMADILMLKPMLENIGVDIEGKANISDFYKKIIEKPELIERILDGLEKEKMSDITTHIMPFLAGVQKIENLNTNEQDTVSIMEQMTEKNASDIKIRLLKKYIQREANINIDNSDNKYFDICVLFITELNMIFNSTSVISSNNISEGLALYELGKYKEAIQCYDKAIDIDPDDADAYYNKGCALDSLEQYKEVIKYYDKAIEIDPDDADAYNNKGYALYCLKQYKEAIKCYDKVIEIDPDFALAYNNKGCALDSLKQYKEAIKCYDKAIEIDPDYKDAYYWKGLTLTSLEQYKEAIKCYDKAIDIDSDDKDAYYFKGNALLCLEQYKEAIKCYDKAIDIDPDYKVAYYNKGVALQYVAGKEREAKQWFDKAYELGYKD